MRLDRKGKRPRSDQGLWDISGLGKGLNQQNNLRKCSQRNRRAGRPVIPLKPCEGGTLSRGVTALNVVSALTSRFGNVGHRDLGVVLG